MKVAVILENIGGELDRKVIDIHDEGDEHAAIEEVLEEWLISVGDTIRIVEVQS